jgi:hypothetical protein
MKKKAFTVRTPSGKHADMGLFCSWWPLVICRADFPFPFQYSTHCRSSISYLLDVIGRALSSSWITCHAESFRFLLIFQTSPSPIILMEPLPSDQMFAYFSLSLWSFSHNVIHTLI